MRVIDLEFACTLLGGCAAVYMFGGRGAVLIGIVVGCAMGIGLRLWMRHYARHHCTACGHAMKHHNTDGGCEKCPK